MCSKAFTMSLLLFYRFLVRRLKAIHGTTTMMTTMMMMRMTLTNPKMINRRATSLDALASGQVMLCGVEGGLLRRSSTFPYFMLVALEGGGLLRGLLLLVLYPLLCILSHEVGVKVMVMVCFCGIKKESFRVGRVVLPKFLLQDVGWEVFEVVKRSKKVVCLSGMPRVMVEGFLKDYLEMDVVIGRELREFKGYFLGLMEEEGNVLESLGLEGIKEHGVVGINGVGSLANFFHELFLHCKEVYVASEADRRRWHPLPRFKYPKPLIFHDGRIAFKPTPSSTLSMFMWLPVGIALAVTRAAFFLTLPYPLSIPLTAFLGMHSREVTPPPPLPKDSNGHLFVSNHRTLLDPLYIAATVNRSLTAATYSISRSSELLSPVKTIRLTRNREADKEAMEASLEQGDLVLCPEGTTCREPYLLRFSALFAELRRPVVPVALATWVGMFYGTTAGGRKCLDPLYFLMNPCPSCSLEYLDTLDTEGCNANGSSRDIANEVQRQIGMALGFECTSLTRRDKYLMLAGNEGNVESMTKKSSKLCFGLVNWEKKVIN